MSRIGKQPVSIPSGVNVSLSGSKISAKGPKGNLEFAISSEVKVDVKADVVDITRNSDTKEARSIHGLTRSLVSNMLAGVNTGFEKKLEIVGVGYKAEVKGDKIVLALGFSHPINYPLPKSIKATVDKQTAVTITGPDKQLVGQVAADIRAFRPPEPYKGKGVRYVGEVVRRKAGKAGKGGA